MSRRSSTASSGRVRVASPRAVPAGGRLLHLDCFSGIAGDMFTAALLDLGLSRRELDADLSGLGLDFSLRDYLFSEQDVEDVTSTDQLMNNLALAGGLTFAFGQGYSADRDASSTKRASAENRDEGKSEGEAEEEEAKGVQMARSPMGAAQAFWTPAQAGAGFEFSPILAPLATFRERLIVLSGLDNP